MPCCVTALYRLWKLIPVLVGSDEEEESIGCRQRRRLRRRPFISAGALKGEEQQVYY